MPKSYPRSLQESSVYLLPPLTTPYTQKKQPWQLQIENNDSIVVKNKYLKRKIDQEGKKKNEIALFIEQESIKNKKNSSINNQID